MALIKLSDYGDIENGICEALAAVAGETQVVVSDDASDFFVASPCQLGNEILENGPVNTNADYNIPIIDPDLGCLTWRQKPPDPDYGSSMLQPWVGGSVGELSIDSGSSGVYEDNWHALADLSVPMFTVDVKLLVHWTALWDGASEFNYCKWYPHYGDQVVYPNVGNAVGFANGILRDAALGRWKQGSYTMFIDVPAGTSGKYLSVMFLGCVGSAHGRIAAVAFKA